MQTPETRRNAYAVNVTVGGSNAQDPNSTAFGLVGRMAAPAAAGRPNEGGTLASELPLPPGNASGGEAALRLEKRTHLNNPSRFRITLRNYGHGLGEVGWSFISSVPPCKSPKGKSDNRAANEDRAVRRARSRLRQLILSARADHLLTLTYRENVTDFQQASADLTRFVRMVKARTPEWVYVAVGERQKRGAWHWHMAVHGRQDVHFLRSAWRSVVGEGNIDVNPPKGDAHNRQLALVKYLGKYLAKSFLDEDRQLNARRFRASLGIPVPLEYFSVAETDRGNVMGVALNQLKIASGSVGFVWLAGDKTAGWACSWK